MLSKTDAELALQRSGLEMGTADLEGTVAVYLYL